MEDQLRTFLETVDSWEVMRRQYAARSDAAGLSSFVTSMNHHTRKLISILDRQSPEWWDALAECATHASTLTTPGANVFVNKAHHTKA